MKLRKLVTALVAALALGAVMASNAFAFATTTDVQWYTGNYPGTLLEGSEFISAVGSSEFVTEIASVKLKLKSTELECVSCAISNVGGVASGSGNLLFKRVTVTQPASCAVEGGKIETKVLSIKPDYMEGTTSFALFTPFAGGEIFATVKLVKGSGSCSLSGSYNITGDDFMQERNVTGLFAVSQGLTSSHTINSFAGGELRFGNWQADLNTTSASIALSGPNSHKEFATK